MRCQSRLSLLPAARVAVVGAGVGGCSAAYFLREHGGEKLDLHVFQKPGSAVGGRTAVIDFCGHTYESGGSILHTSNKYMVDFAQQFGEGYYSSFLIFGFPGGGGGVGGGKYL